MPAVLALETRWAAENITYGFVPSAKAALRAALGPLFLIAESTETVVGFVRAHVFVCEGNAVIAEGERCLDIDDLFILR